MAKNRKRVTPAQIRSAAQRYCGFESLRPGQEEAIRSILDKRDTLVIQPTGSGKSAIYQIAGALIDGETIVVSPLIALQRDQVDTIEEIKGLPEAEVINSARRVSEIRQAWDRIGKGRTEFVFLAPEQLTREDTLEKLKSVKPSLFVVDEAHCISEWGHDFRPDYLRLGSIIKDLGRPAILALTATANPAVRDEIVQRLEMRKPDVIVRGFDRPNIHLSVVAFGSEGEKTAALIDRIESEPKPGIVYTATRKYAETIAAALSDRGIDVVHYHGGLPAKERDRIQSLFMGGDADVIVATNAFGMGIDKPDVRFVFHADIAESLDAYYQEIGRAGRDGKPAVAVLFYRPEDLGVRKFLKGGGKVDQAQMQHIAELIHAEDGPVAVEELQSKTNLSERKISRALSRLEEAGAVETSSSGDVVAGEESPEIAEAARLAVAEQDRRAEADRLRLEKMQAYAELSSCRREYLLTHFGDTAPARCNRCDNCEKSPERPRPSLTRNARVAHKQLGRGLVESVREDKITILFDEAGRKTLSRAAVEANRLLERIP